MSRTFTRSLTSPSDSRSVFVVHGRNEPDEVALCGVAAGLESWWTPAQLEHGFGMASGALDQAVQDAVANVFNGMKGMRFKPNSSFSLDIETPVPLVEPDDMIIVEPPCHKNEPPKVPQASTEKVFCLICGARFAA